MRTAAIWLLGCLATAPTFGADGAWQDVEGRIQYGFYTEDARSLEALADTLNKEEGTDELRHYYLALTHYRLALLSEQRAPGQSKSAAEHCVASLDAYLDTKADAPEALALQSACLELVSHLASPLAGLRSAAQMRHALRLAPHNPRVMLLKAQSDYAHASSTAERGKLTAELQRAVAAFEEERRGTEEPPSWGAAEAYELLATSYLDQGDALAARGALEHALLLVPDFEVAHRLLKHIIVG
jgi:hypothetical protein